MAVRCERSLPSWPRVAVLCSAPLPFALLLLLRLNNNSKRLRTGAGPPGEQDIYSHKGKRAKCPTSTAPRRVIPGNGEHLPVPYFNGPIVWPRRAVKAVYRWAFTLKQGQRSWREAFPMSLLSAMAFYSRVRSCLLLWPLKS